VPKNEASQQPQLVNKMVTIVTNGPVVYQQHQTPTAPVPTYANICLGQLLYVYLANGTRVKGQLTGVEKTNKELILVDPDTNTKVNVPVATSRINIYANNVYVTENNYNYNTNVFTPVANVYENNYNYRSKIVGPITAKRAFDI